MTPVTRFRLSIVLLSAYFLVIILANSSPVPVSEERQDKELKKSHHKSKDAKFGKEECIIIDESELMDDEEMLHELENASKEEIDAMMENSPYLQKAIKSKVKHELKSRKKMDKVLKKIAKLQEQQDQLYQKKAAKIAELKEKVALKLLEKKLKLEKLKEKFKYYEQAE